MQGEWCNLHLSLLLRLAEKAYNSRASMMLKVVPLEHCVASAVSATLNSGVLFPCLKWWYAIFSIALQSDCSALIPELSEQLAIFNHITAQPSAPWCSWRWEQMCVPLCYIKGLWGPNLDIFSFWDREVLWCPLYRWEMLKLTVHDLLLFLLLLGQQEHKLWFSMS